MEWFPIATAPEAQVVVTKIHDADGPRNEQTLKRMCGLWFIPDGSMYVYYQPTHWRPVQDVVMDCAGRLIATPQPELPPRPAGPHTSNHDAREPVRE